MIRIWGRTSSSNVQKVMWTVAELGIEHERVDAGGEHGLLDTDAYGALNPNRRIPTLEDGDVVVWESNAIVRYLSAKFGAGRLWPLDHAARGVADEWMDWQQTTLLDDMRIVFWGLVRTPPDRRDPERIEAATQRLKELWGRLDRHLAGRAFVAGEQLTMGDIPVGTLCHRYHALGIERAPLRRLEAWYERLTSRAAFRRHVMLPLV